jgi:hypothetical protein
MKVSFCLSILTLVKEEYKRIPIHFSIDVFQIKLRKKGSKLPSGGTLARSRTTRTGPYSLPYFKTRAGHKGLTMTAQFANALKRATKKKQHFRTNWAAALNSASTTDAPTITEKGGALEIINYLAKIKLNLIYNAIQCPPRNNSSM